MRAAALLLILVLMCGCGISAGAQENTSVAAGEESAAVTQEETAAPADKAAAGAQEETAAPAKGAAAGVQENTAAGIQEETTGAAEEASAAEGVSAESIENNGGFFVRVGNKVYFRKYGQQAVENSALFGQFLEYSLQDGKSVMLAYDLETGEVTEAFEDTGYGRLFAGDGGFYCKRAGNGYGDIAYWISLDGTQSTDFGQAAPLGISTEAPESSSASNASENSEDKGNTSETTGKTSPAEASSFVTLRDQDPDHAGDLFILHGGEETARAVRGADESLEFCGMTGEYAVYLVCNTEKNVNYLYSLSGKSGEAVCLGEMPISKEEYFYPYLESEQFLSDEKGVYIVASNYQGTGHFLAYSLAVSAVPGTADSLKLIESSWLPEEEEDGREEAEEAEAENAGKEGEPLEAAEDDAEEETDSENWNPTPPVLFLTAPGEAQIVPGPAGTAELSEGGCGDLIYYDSPFSAVKLISEYIPESEWEASDRRFLQTAEVIGDAVYIIMADTARNEAEDIGWRMSYQLKELSWLRIPLPEKLQDDSGEGAEPDLLAQELF